MLFNPLVNKVFSFFFRVERINFQRVVFFVGFANVPFKGFVVKFGAEVKEDEHIVLVEVFHAIRAAAVEHIFGKNVAASVHGWCFPRRRFEQVSIRKVNKTISTGAAPVLFNDASKALAH